jgi:exonuclease SbcC
VHREVVPELTGLLRAWLPRLTEERYIDVRMDPATLAVEVCGPTREFRRAELLSHGTAEQIYLLLRVALAARLTEGHDTCPLLLDDVTVHADPERTGRMLDLLHRLSGERQIVLFAHQDQVREWAHARFDGERDALIELLPVGVELAVI